MLGERPQIARTLHDHICFDLRQRTGRGSKRAPVHASHKPASQPCNAQASAFAALQTNVYPWVAGSSVALKARSKACYNKASSYSYNAANRF